MATQTGVKKLEKKVNLLSKALHLLLYEKKEKISKKEAHEIERRLSAYLKARKDDFVNLEDVVNAESKNKQKGSKRA
jgi:ElaB/YqjD/DUF883 family membrane-anchored ribosome-binding protein